MKIWKNPHNALAGKKSKGHNSVHGVLSFMSKVDRCVCRENY